jgi:hypothetical protein
MSEFNQPNIDNAKKLFNEHQDLHKFLSEKNLENTSLVFFNPEIKIDPNRGHGSYNETIINLKDDDIEKEINHNKLYLPGIKIENDKLYSEQELGKTIPEEILINENIITYSPAHSPKYIFKHYKIVSEEIPQDIIDSIKQIEKLEVEIVKEKNKILNSIYVKNKLNNKFENIDEYKNLIKCLHS